MISNWKITGLLSLCILSTLACGFSTWVLTNNDAAVDVGKITVDVGDIVETGGAVSFVSAEVPEINKYGFAHSEILTNGNTVTYFDCSWSISTTWTVDCSVYKSLSYSIAENQTVNFFTSSTDTAKYDSTSLTLTSTTKDNRNYKADIDVSSISSKVTIVITHTGTIDTSSSTFESVYNSLLDAHNNLQLNFAVSLTGVKE